MGLQKLEDRVFIQIVQLSVNILEKFNLHLINTVDEPIFLQKRLILSILKHIELYFQKPCCKDSSLSSLFVIVSLILVIGSLHSIRLGSSIVHVKAGLQILLQALIALLRPKFHELKANLFERAVALNVKFGGLLLLSFLKQLICPNTS